MNEKKPLVILVVGDAGAAEALAPTMPRLLRRAEVEVYADPRGAGSRTLTKLGIQHEIFEHLTEVDAKRADVVVCGTSSKAQQLQRQATIAAQHAGTSVVWVSDFYLSGCEANMRDVRPDVLTVIDRSAMLLATSARSDLSERCVPKTTVVITGNPAFDEIARLRTERATLRSRVRANLELRDDQKLIVFGGSASNQFSLDEMEATVKRIIHSAADGLALFSFHPADPNVDKLKTMVSGIEGCRVFNDDLVMYAAADAVVVQYSTIGVKSALLGVPTLFALLPSARSYQRSRGNAWPFFPQIGLGAAEAAWSIDEIEPALARMVSADEPDYHEAHQRVVEHEFMSLIDGHAAFNVANVIMSQVPKG